MPAPLRGIARNPITDLTGMLINQQYYGKCAELEMQALSCLEAHGHISGLQNCRVILEDYIECFSMKKQFKRFTEMRRERFRQHRKGERSKKELYGKGPRLDSFE